MGQPPPPSRKRPLWAFIVVPHNKIRTVVLKRADSEVARHYGAYVLAREDDALVNPVLRDGNEDGA